MAVKGPFSIWREENVGDWPMIDVQEGWSDEMDDADVVALISNALLRCVDAFATMHMRRVAVVGADGAQLLVLWWAENGSPSSWRSTEFEVLTSTLIAPGWLDGALEHTVPRLNPG